MTNIPTDGRLGVTNHLYNGHPPTRSSASEPVESICHRGIAGSKDDLKSQLSKHESKRSLQLPLQQTGYEKTASP